MLRTKSCYIAKGKDSCPLASVVYASLEAKAYCTAPNAMAICEKAICDQINRKISYEECCQILSFNAHTIVPATMISKVLHAFDYHMPDIGEPTETRNIDHRRCRMWRPEEDILLLAAIHKFGLGDWKSISQFVGGDRSRSQCSQRWGRALDPRITKLPWGAEEEQQLVDLVAELGEHSWANVAKRLGTRSDVQCRYRYYQISKRKPSLKAKPEIDSPPPQSPPSVMNYFVGQQNSLPKVEETIPLPTIAHVDILFGKNLFDCPIDELIPPLRPKSSRSSEPSSPINISSYVI